MPAKRSYKVYEGGGTVLQMFGDAGGFFRRMAILYPDYMDRSIRHGGYMAQNRLKIEFLQHAPAARSFPIFRRFNVTGRWMLSKSIGTDMGSYNRTDQSGSKLSAIAVLSCVQRDWHGG